MVKGTLHFKNISQLLHSVFIPCCRYLVFFVIKFSLNLRNGKDMVKPGTTITTRLDHSHPFITPPRVHAVRLPICCTKGLPSITSDSWKPSSPPAAAPHRRTSPHERPCPVLSSPSAPPSNASANPSAAAASTPRRSANRRTSPPTMPPEAETPPST
jgi:hypothetical protein